jgi:prepilin-type N-terminal cleavage/methylation domain-containing protein
MAAVTQMRRFSANKARRGTGGFSLTEMAVVLVIVGLLVGGMMMPLSAQTEFRQRQDTERYLADAREALLGFAIANERLPCPASNTSNGLESFCADNNDGGCTVTTAVQRRGRCSNPHDGFLPAVSLSYAPVDTNGYAIDGWAPTPPNRIRYAVSSFIHAPANTTTVCQPDLDANGAPDPGTMPFRPFTCAQGMKEIYSLAASADLRICKTGTGITNSGNPVTADCAAGNALASEGVAILLSLGKNASVGGTSDDEAPNLNADRAFVSTTVSSSFDDQLVWLSRGIVFGRMVSAGRLP